MLTLPDSIVKRYALKLTDMTVNDSVIYGHVFYRVRKGIFLTNHNTIGCGDPCHFSKQKLWILFRFSNLYTWHYVFSEYALAQSNFDILRLVIKEPKRIKIENPN